MTPKSLAHYDILEQIGRGGMGEVFRARDRRLQRDVALKMLPADLAAHPGRLAMLEREAMTVASLNHPNIVTLYAIEEADGQRFITMELVDGTSLEGHVKPEGLSLQAVLEVAIPLAEALVAAHERGVVHRDLKPGNIMITADGRVKVLDFGLAKLADSEAAIEDTEAATLPPTVSTPGQIAGTVPYMAPEQVRGETVDTRSDLFAFGIILYELVTGHRPFSGDTSADLTSAILRDAPDPVRTVRDDVPPDLERIIARCLEKDPDRRVQTAKDVRNELEHLRPASSPAPASPAAAPEIPSIAVLPFVNHSRDEEDEYFADGLADEVMNVLSKIRGLRVAARTSSFQFKGKSEDLAVIGEKLHVASLLEGTVRKVGNRLRVSVQLVKVADGFQLWSESYDRTLDDIFEVQDDIARCVVKELRTTLLGEDPDSDASNEAVAEVALAARGRGESGEAHRLFLHGRHLIDRYSGTDIPKGIEYLNRATTLDPGHARAWVWLARAYSFGGAYGVFPVDDANARAREAVDRALDLEPDLVEAFIARASSQLMYDWDWDGARMSLQRAIELAPDNVGALLWQAILAYYFNRLDESEAACRRIIDLDPLSVTGYTQLGRTHRSAGRYTEAEAAFRRAVELSPGGTAIHLLLSSTLYLMGRLDDALEEAEKEDSEWGRLTGLAAAHFALGNRAEADAALEELIETGSDDCAYQIASCYAIRGDKDAAFTWLERTYDTRDSGLPLLKSEPTLRSLHDDPRWDDLIQRMGLVD